MSVPVGDTPAPPPSSPGVTPPTVVRDDVWTVDSGSTLGGRQTPEQLQETEALEAELAALRESGVLEPLLMIPMGLGMSTINAAMMFFDPISMATKQTVDATKIGT